MLTLPSSSGPAREGLVATCFGMSLQFENLNLFALRPIQFVGGHADRRHPCRATAGGPNGDEPRSSRVVGGKASYRSRDCKLYALGRDMSAPSRGLPPCLALPPAGRDRLRLCYSDSLPACSATVRRGWRWRGHFDSTPMLGEPVLRWDLGPLVSRVEADTTATEPTHQCDHGAFVATPPRRTPNLSTA